MEKKIQTKGERTKEASEAHQGESITAEETEEEIRNIFKGGKC